MRLLNKGLLIVLLLILQTANGESAQKADAVLVIKSESRLYLMNKGERIASFPVTFGAEPTGHKQAQGDERTPEGHYTLGYKNPNSDFYKSIHISYPNAKDRENARRLGVDPGGDIMIHGYPNGIHSSWWSRYWFLGRDWTDGCIAVSNEAIEEIWKMVKDGTPIHIHP